MKYNLFSIVAGSEVCNARCPFCVSKMTPPNGIGAKEPEVDWRRFKQAAQFARNHGVSTAMITSKGEPTLFPRQIREYLMMLEEFGFSPVELQTNGIPIANEKPVTPRMLEDWRQFGLTTIAISVVHYEPEKNRQIYLPHQKKYIDLPALIARLHDKGFTVRLSCTMLKNFIDSPDRLRELIDFCREHKVEQLTARPVAKPQHSRDEEVYSWTQGHELTNDQIAALNDYVETAGFLLQKLGYGARVYDICGQNFCFSNCLTRDPETDEIRQLIWFPDGMGHLKYDWEHPGASIF